MTLGCPFCRTVGEKPGPCLRGHRASPEPRADLCQTSSLRHGVPVLPPGRCAQECCPDATGAAPCMQARRRAVDGRHLLRKATQSLETAPPWWWPHLLRAHF